MDSIHQFLVDVWSNQIMTYVDLKMLYVSKYFYNMAKTSILKTKLTTLVPKFQNFCYLNNYDAERREISYLILHLCGAILCKDNRSIETIIKRMGGICQLEALFISCRIFESAFRSSSSFPKSKRPSFSFTYKNLCKYVTRGYKWSYVYPLVNICNIRTILGEMSKMPDLEEICSDVRIITLIDNDFSSGSISKTDTARDLMRSFPIPNNVAKEILKKRGEKSKYVGFLANRISDKYMNRCKQDILIDNQVYAYSNTVIYEFVFRNPRLDYSNLTKYDQNMGYLVMSARFSANYVPELSTITDTIRKYCSVVIKHILNLYFESHLTMVKDNIGKLLSDVKFLPVLLRSPKRKQLCTDLTTDELISFLSVATEHKYVIQSIKEILEERIETLPKNFLDFVAVRAIKKLKVVMETLQEFKISRVIVNVLDKSIFNIDESRIR